MGDSTEMRAYTKYSFFIERKVGLGRNGKRLLHGAAGAGAVYAAGYYGDVTYINENMPQALVIGGATGVIATVIADSVLITDHEQALMDLESLRISENSNPAMRKIVDANRARIQALRDGTPADTSAGGSKKGPSLIRRSNG